MPRAYKKNIKALYVVHAPDAAKFFFRMVLFMVSRKFWKKVSACMRANVRVRVRT